MTAPRALLPVVGLLLAAHAAHAGDPYSKWATDEKKQKHTCTYTYKSNDPKVEYAKQNVVVYSADKDYAGWAYYYNADSKPWARCAIPGNPKYEAKKMYWEKMTPDEKGYEPFKDDKGQPQPIGYCPVPKDGVDPVPDLPLPPK